jgi:hypothetical protein
MYVHLNGILHKSVPSGCISMCIPRARHLFSKNMTETTNTHVIVWFLGGCCSMRSVFYERRLWACQSYFTTDGQSVSVSGFEPTLGLVTRYCFLSEGSCRKFAVLFLWGALSDERTSLQLAVQSPNGPSRAELVTMLYCLIWDSPNWRARFPCLYPPGRGWPSYTPGHRVPFTSHLTTRRATVDRQRLGKCVPAAAKNFC